MHRHYWRQSTKRLPRYIISLRLNSKINILFLFLTIFFFFLPTLINEMTAGAHFPNGKRVRWAKEAPTSYRSHARCVGGLDKT